MCTWRKIDCAGHKIQLLPVLLGGQSFRWKQKCADEYLGVFANCVWQLKQTDDVILFQRYSNISETSDEAEETLKNYLRLDVDLSSLYSSWCESDQYFKESAVKFNGIRILKQDVFENIFSFICSSNNNISRISSMVEKLCEMYGDPIATIDGKEYCTFPDVEALTGSSVETQLRKAGFGYRAKFINQSACKIVEEGTESWLNNLKCLSYADAKAELMKLSGIGAKVADCICLMSLNHLNAVPVDTHVFQIACKRYLPHLKNNKSVTTRVYNEVGDHFRKIFGDKAGWAHTVLRCRSILNIPKRNFQRALHTTALRFLPKTVPYILSDIGEGIVDVTVKEWYVKEGDAIAQFDPVCEVQSDKASVTITSRFDGRVGRLHYGIDQIAKVGAPLLDIVVEEESADPVNPVMEIKVPVPSQVEVVVEEKAVDKALATPAVRRIAKENQIDLTEVKATGKGGRVLKEDILAHLNVIQTPVETTIEIKTQADISDSPSSRNGWSENIVGIRKAMAKTMTQAWTIPHFTYGDDINVTALVSMKSDLKKMEEQNSVKITYLPFMLKAISQALLRYPRLNSETNADCSILQVHGNHNLGVAVDSPDGLIVPNIKSVDKLTVVEIARELTRLQTLAKQGRLGNFDLEGGTFTVSNIGAIGGTVATPVILPPQVAIVALGKIQKLPRFDGNGAVTPVDILTFNCSADHRVVDGASVARFVNLFKLYISSPQLLLHL